MIEINEWSGYIAAISFVAVASEVGPYDLAQEYQDAINRYQETCKTAGVNPFEVEKYGS